MTNLPIRGETDSLDNLAVTREEFRVGMGQLLEYLAQALGAVNTTYEDQVVDPQAVVLQGEPALETGAVPDPADDSLRVPSTSWVQEEIADLVDDLVAKAGSTMTGNLTIPSLNDGPLAGLRNLLINGDFRVDQRSAGLSGTVGAGAAFLYDADRWYLFCSGANVTAQQITVAGTQVDPRRYQFTGAASVTGIGIGQRIEAANSRHLAGKRATLSVNLSNSLLTSVSWEAFYANSNDTFGTRASPSRTSIASGTFTVSSSYSRFSASFDVPAGATTGIEIVFTVGAQTSGTWVIGQAQLEEGPVATPFERRSLALEEALCQRYFCWLPYNVFFYAVVASQSLETGITFPVKMRANPTIGAAVTDPNTTNSVFNNSSSAIQRVTPYSCGITLTGSVANANVFVVGYRFSATAEL